MKKSAKVDNIKLIIDLLCTEKLKVINLGLPLFAENLSSQGMEIVHIDWQPPANNENELMDILEILDNYD